MKRIKRFLATKICAWLAPYMIEEINSSVSMIVNIENPLIEDK